MTNSDIFKELTYIDPAFVAEAAPGEKPRRSRLRPWVKWGAWAACLCLAVVLGFRLRIAFTPSQATDIFREGVCMEITDPDQLPAAYDGALLVKNLELTDATYEFYYKEGGDPARTDDWYSLLLNERYGEGSILLHCMFGDPAIEDWKVDRVFTEKATETRLVHGVEVQIARLEPSLRAEYWYYAIFKLDGVVYDLRTLSDDAAYMYKVLDTLLGDQGS